MSKEITKTIEKTIAISEFDNKRCSRNCDYCIKTNGNYRCYLNSTCGDWEEIEGFAGYDDVETKEYEAADTYGFKRTKYCLKTFENYEDDDDEQI